MRDKRLRAGLAMLTAAAALAPGTIAPAQEGRPSYNLYGVTGLIDMPSAESQPDAQLGASYSVFGNTTRRNFTFQMLPRLSGTLRYATINDWGRPNDPSFDLFDRSFDLQLQILKERYEPGADTGRVPLVHEGEEGGIVISGRLEVTVDSERRILGPGDAYYFESHRPHRFRAVGPTPCEVVSACTPPSF